MIKKYDEDGFRVDQGTDDQEEDPLQHAFEWALDECGRVDEDPETPGLWCTMAGTEFCDFRCPFRDG